MYKYVNQESSAYKFDPESVSVRNYKRSAVTVMATRTPHDWVRWDGGTEPPVPVINQYDYEFLRRDGERAAVVTSWRHGNENGDRDIVAYRLKPKPTPDMTDWKNWRLGDELEFLNFGQSFTKGRIYTLQEIQKDLVRGKDTLFIIDDSMRPHPWDAPIAARNFRWIRHHISRDATQS